MTNSQLKIMREVLIEQIYDMMHENDKIIFLSDDFGAIALDKLREKFKDRFINVGIAEQNLVNLAAGMTLEGFIVCVYGIVTFLTMRNYEQIKVNLSILSQLREMNVNLIGVGTGLSYDLCGPTHHSLEDVSVIRILPNILIFSPSDWVLVKKSVDFLINVKKPKYIRLDGKPLPQIYDENQKINIEEGFYELVEGEEVCMITTGYMTHKALRITERYFENRVGVIDVFLLKSLKENLLFECLKKYKYLITIEEAFKNKGGLDTLISTLLNSKQANIRLKKMGFDDRHVFDIGSREYLHKQHNLDEQSIVKVIKESQIN